LYPGKKTSSEIYDNIKGQQNQRRFITPNSSQNGGQWKSLHPGKGCLTSQLLHVACLHALHVLDYLQSHHWRKIQEKTSLFVGDYDAAL